ncbi:Long cell-linked locus protein, putative, expressed [Melia azedarach]|uniref:Long cell-linked locus protein, putative, expressed n=1 Tax=Melia azedarach TaxID=155640 RepID=A0ACC1YWF1_MELAZ|nr:Long cell-linked locus protein, putative, expressed [Melia azedarach]
MPKKNSDVTQRAWNLLRLALLWARKGGVFKRRLMMELRLVPKFIKSLGRATPRDQLHYGERELSFDKTPIFHVKMHRPASMRYLIPCITPQVDFDFDFDDDDGVDGYDDGRQSFLKNGEDDDDHQEEEYIYGYEAVEEKIPIEEQGIDLRAEEFIAKFYQQIKMQRQISYLEYNERLSSNAS